jgi:hypothetical protein
MQCKLVSLIFIIYKLKLINITFSNNRADVILAPYSYSEDNNLIAEFPLFYQGCKFLSILSSPKVMQNWIIANV